MSVRPSCLQFSHEPIDGEAIGAAGDVGVGVRTFGDVFAASPLPVALDTYQRGFVWGVDKARQLAEDLLAYQALPEPKPPYYMGAILLHEHEEKRRRYIIDGQQRLTALCVLHQQLRNTLPDRCAMSFSSRSAATIRAVAKEFASAAIGLHADVLDRILFSVISVRRADLAFTFFDTQNHRGVQLHATDLLKAFHLRAIELASPLLTEQVQSNCAQRWERLQQGTQAQSHETVAALFDRYLWRARRWSGTHTPGGRHDALMKEFQGPGWAQHPDRKSGRISLYQARSNRRAAVLVLGPEGRYEAGLEERTPRSEVGDLPFSIRQPIQNGAGFFLFVDKYASLLTWLTQERSTDVQVGEFRKVLQGMVAANSLFLREAFLVASLMFVDQFGSEQLWPFSLWLEYALGAVRLKKQQVRQETAQKFFREDPRANLLDVIATAFHPEQVIAHLRAMATESYADENVQVDKGGVHGTYKKAVLAYFGRDPGDRLSAKAGWIHAKLSKVGA